MFQIGESCFCSMFCEEAYWIICLVLSLWSLPLNKLDFLEKLGLCAADKQCGRYTSIWYSSQNIDFILSSNFLVVMVYTNVIPLLLVLSHSCKYNLLSFAGFELYVLSSNTNMLFQVILLRLTQSKKNHFALLAPKIQSTYIQGL